MDAVIFDLDGVLVASDNDWARVWHGYLRELGVSWSAEDRLATLGWNMKQCYEYVASRYGLLRSEEEVATEIVSRRISMFSDGVIALPGAASAVIATAKRCGVGLASSSPMPVIDAVLDQLQLRGYFGAITSCDEVAAGKPAADVYLLSCERLKVRPEYAIAVEDSPQGIESARCAGLKVVAVTNGTRLLSEDCLQSAHLVVDTLLQWNLDQLLQLGHECY